MSPLPSRSGLCAALAAVLVTTGAGLGALVAAPPAYATTGLTATPPSLSFTPLLEASTSATQTVSVQNNSGGGFAFNDFYTDNPDFIISATPTRFCGQDVGNHNFPNGKACLVNVAFRPSVSGTDTGNLVFNDGHDGNVYVPLAGVGIAPDSVAFNPSPLAFDPVALTNTSNPVAVSVTNQGSASLSFPSAGGDIVIGGANPGDFVTSADTCSGATVAPAGSCGFDVTFSPSSIGEESATLSLSNGDGQSETLDLSGPAVSPVGLSPALMTFPAQADATTSDPSTLTITDNGSTSVDVIGLSVTGPNAADFSPSTTCGSIASGMSCSAQVTFTPTGTGTETATLSVADTAVGSPQTVALSGVAVALSYSSSALDFPGTLDGVSAPAETMTVTNNAAGSAIDVGMVSIGGTNPADFVVTDDTCSTVSLPASSSCSFDVVFTPSGPGPEAATLSIPSTDSSSPMRVDLSGTGLVPSGVGLGSPAPSAPVVPVGPTTPAPTPLVPAPATAPPRHGGSSGVTPDGGGYWLIGPGDTIDHHGDAGFFGSPAGIPLRAPLVAIAGTPDGAGYWVVGADGGVFGFGDARFFGSLGGVQLAAPIVGLVPTPSGQGYWLVGADGGVFDFGDASFLGSMGGVLLAAPIVGLVPTQSGHGYWLVGADGGVFGFGDASFLGSMGGVLLAAPIVGLVPTQSGQGYWLVGADGGVFSVGDARFFGSLGGVQLVAPIVGSFASAPGYTLVGTGGDSYRFGT